MRITAKAPKEKEIKISYKVHPYLNFEGGVGYVRFLRVTHPFDAEQAQELFDELDAYLRHGYPKLVKSTLDKNVECSVYIAFTDNSKVVFSPKNKTALEEYV